MSGEATTVRSVESGTKVTAPSLHLVSDTCREEPPVLRILLRYFLYACALTILMLTFKLVAVTGGIKEFTEGGLVEQGQVLVLLSTLAVFTIGATRRTEWQGLFISLETLIVAAVFRELDAFLDMVNPLWGWKLPVTLTATTGAILVYRARDSFVRGLKQLVRGRAFTLLWCGFVVAVPVAQHFGHEPLLQVLWGDLYIRDQKRVIEEMCEFVGYALIFLGAIELTRYEPREERLPTAP